MKTINERAHELVHEFSKGVKVGQEIPNYYDKVSLARTAFTEQRKVDYEELGVRMCNWYCDHCEVQSDCSSNCHDIESIKRIFEL